LANKNLEKIFAAYNKRVGIKKYSHLATLEKIETFVVLLIFLIFLIFLTFLNFLNFGI
jgi:hypothetical protein